MNLNLNPTAGQLRELLRQHHDPAGNHVLWVKRSGEVELTTVPRDQPPGDFERVHPDLQLRCETFLAGNEYVGPDAAEDEEWVAALYGRLLGEWSRVKGNREVVTLD